jgi:hypothetical protein
MNKLIKVGIPLVVTLLPMGCGDKTDGPPTAPTASSVPDTATKVPPPPAVVKGQRTVQPAGAGSAEP